MTISFSARRVAITLTVISLVLVGLHLVFHYLGSIDGVSPLIKDIGRRFDMDHEASIPTWFGQMILLVAAVLFWYIGHVAHSAKAAFRWHWSLLALIFLYLSLDEGAELHELTIAPVQVLLGIESGPLFFAWLIPAAAAVILLALTFFRFFLNLPNDTKGLLVLAALLFFAGAMGIETISGSYWEANDFAYDMQYRIFNAIEEGLEILGVTVAIYGLMRHAAALPNKATTSLRFTK